MFCLTDNLVTCPLRKQIFSKENVSSSLLHLFLGLGLPSDLLALLKRGENYSYFYKSKSPKIKNERILKHSPSQLNSSETFSGQPLNHSTYFL